MSNNDVTFGWVVQPVPKGFPEEIMSNPTKAGQALMDANEQFIQAVQPHFDTIWVEDHFQWGARPVLEALTTLTYLAARHEQMRFGNLVLAQSYRNPALIAKIAANLQLMTRGRFILGIGAGWKEDEYLAYGYAYPPAGQRVDELADAVRVIRAMWRENPASYEGDYYTIRNAECIPRPNPPIPLLIAGGGEKKTLAVVARYADWWSHNFCTAEEYAHKQQVLDQHCRYQGRDPQQILRSYFAAVSLVKDPAKAERREDFHVIGGTPDMVARELGEFVEMGVRHMQIRFLDFPRHDGLNMFVEQVIPLLKG